MKKTMILLLACLLVCHVSAYNRQDNMKIVSLLQEAKSLKQKPKSWMLWFGKKFIGVPYVAGTLDRTKEEQLVINTRQLDCTTYVEMVTALTLCAQKGQTSFAQYCEHLKHVRYIGGKVEYTKTSALFHGVDQRQREGGHRDRHTSQSSLHSCSESGCQLDEHTFLQLQDAHSSSRVDGRHQGHGTKHYR